MLRIAVLVAIPIAMGWWLFGLLGAGIGFAVAAVVAAFHFIDFNDDEDHLR